VEHSSVIARSPVLHERAQQKLEVKQAAGMKLN
jgi:hypothetical protein